MGVCVWTMGEGAVEMGICECLGPGVKGFRGWVSVSIGAMGEGLRGECLQVSRARGEEFRGFLSMGVLHTYYITYTCLCTHLITMIYVLTGGRVSKHVLAHNFLNIQWIFNPKKVLES